MDRTTDAIVTDAEAGIARAELQLVKAKAELELKKRILSLLPKTINLNPKVLHGGGYKCDGGITFEMTERAQGLALLEVLPPVEALFVKQVGGFSSFMPKSRFNGVLKHQQTATPYCGVKYDVQGAGKWIMEDLEWWTQLDGLLIAINVRLAINSPIGIQAKSQVERDARRKRIPSWSLLGIPQGRYVSWGGATLEAPGSCSVYWETREAMQSEMLLADGYRAKMKAMQDEKQLADQLGKPSAQA
jgi:hypothetical protein